MSPVCPFCGETFKRGRQACPHCGSDAQTGWSQEEDSYGHLDLPTEMDDEAYQDFLAAEGLGPPRRNHRPPLQRWGLILALLAMAAVAGIVWLVLR